ncbi:DMT family transporter [Actinoplanes sichuanensis]|uniref:DMT family transporter n=1 Tax=Actinoplanes sichuanensis TaxID=512349 RepID=A0ABW4AED8_9ACTN|nr:DMT family transporter [Actinoplanes sichuanensis]
MGSLGWAVTLSLLSVAAYASAAVAQERLAGSGHRGRSRWAAALLLTAAGASLHVVALNFGTVAVVQALGTLTLLFALPIEVVRYRTRISAASWRDAAATVAGLALILSLSVGPDRPALLTGPVIVRLALITVAVMLACGLGAWRAGPRGRAVLLAAAAGVAFGMSSVLSKAVLTSFTTGGSGAVSVPAALLVAVFAVGGYLLGQMSYRGAGLAAPLATVSVTNPLVAAVAGVVLFGEGVRFGAAGLVTVAVAALVMGWGVVGLARRSAATSTAGMSVR